MPIQKIRPFLWFNDQAEQAAEFYVSIFDNSRITKKMPGPGGTVSGVELELEDLQLIHLNGGPALKLNDAFSLFVTVETQEELDRYWNALLEGGGTPTQCGWLRDRFGVAWQVIPTKLMRYLGDPDQEKAGRVAQAMLKMVKIDVGELERAYAG